ncbi:MAG: hypothetical protein AUK47_07710 [Deltaproteobacteria bacterium CG2_30_63_29]|nr:MAG: hypothetical protein AUK47_07710 [Deltaproteobacteria bacterium CG2_30_63_29]PIV98224.1 MAG: hypothetical protein COW42_15920 [Deltaproteobacteria bacterium CG17_big_fil_post_rev_8_21_14_2_50_63_7]PJB46902.1 MAG: hypothetical protein CO108_04865 [Deltaproteobacteria bacterium CG_4_9_14_3_um_filter_63_12]
MLRQPFKSGAALGRGLEVWAQSVVTLSLVGAVCLVPCVVLFNLGLAGPLHGSWPLAGAISGLGFMLLLVGVVSAPMVFDKLDGLELSLGRSMSRFGATLRPVLAASALLASMLAFLSVAPVLAYEVGAKMPASRRDILVAFAVITSMILIAPIFVSVCLAPYVAVVERVSFTQSVKRSLELSKGNRLGVLAVLVSTVVVLSCISLVFLLPVVLIEDLSRSVGVGAKLAAWCVAAVILAGGSGAIMTTVYHELRVEKEGFGLQALSKIFS